MSARLRPRSSRVEHHFRAVILFIAEHLVHLRRIVDRHAVSDHEAGIDLTRLYAIQQWLHEAHHVRLASLHGQRLVHESAHGNLVVESAVHPRDGHSSTLAACLDGLS